MNALSNTIHINTDSQLIERILRGDTLLFEILIRRYNSVLYKIARAYGFNHQDAEDLLQEAHVAAYENLARFKGRAAYKTWLSKIMVNKCLYALNYGYHKHETPTEIAVEYPLAAGMKTNASQPEEKVVNRELASILEKSLERIPSLYRTVFVLREVEGFSVAETAAVLAITPTNVKVRLNRAKALLQKEIEKVYSQAEIYSFNLVYCDAVVLAVLQRIRPNDAPNASSRL